MVRRLLLLAALVLPALLLLAGCDQLATTMIIGSVDTDAPIDGGTPFHVLVLDAGTVLDPSIPGEVDGVSTVARYDGTFPGEEGESYFTTNYLIADVPPGRYYVFSWIDLSTIGSFDSMDDVYGWYGGVDYYSLQPDGANVVVPDAGVVDVDSYISIPS